MTTYTSLWTASYRARLTIGYLLIVAVFASAWAWSLFGPLTNAVVGLQEEHLLSVAQSGALVLSESDLPVGEIVDRLVARTQLRITVIDADGTVLADSQEDPSLMENHRDRPEIAAALSEDVGTTRRVSATQGTEQIYVAVPATLGGRNVVVRSSSSLETVNAVAANARRWGLILLAVALAFAGVVVARLTASATEPVRRLSEAAEAMAAGNLQARIPEEPGELGTLSAALTDLREQMRARLDDLENEQRTQRSVLDTLTDAVLLLDGTEIRFANAATSTVFKEPVTGWTAQQLDAVELPASVVGAIRDHLDDEVASSEECGPDTLGRHLRVTVLPLAATDGTKQAVVTISDITDRVRVDDVRRDFVANASHELKTPVAGIQLLASSAADAAAAGDADVAIGFAGQISDEAARLGRLVKDLLDLSRLESVPAPDSVADVRRVIANAVVGHRIAAEAKGLDLTVDMSAAANIDAYAAADPTDVVIALDNLIDNAITYTESGSVLVALAVDESDVVVTVADTGIGIPTEDLPRIFERFYRVDRARSRDSGGTGLGLALVRHVVGRSNGSVEVSSVPGGGSTFAVTFPRALSPRKTRPIA
ncbi:MAG: ATP-binding protein [Actinomycetota bacterium]|nr:ATP-binding protein [Actinomycetota bacterium]